MDKKTLVLGVSLKEDRYSNMAVHRLRSNGITTLAYGMREGVVHDVTIDKELMPYDDVHTITLYLNPTRQKEYYDYMISLKPERVIFNPGTENPELYQLLEKNDISYEVACTLVLLGTSQF